VKPKERSAPTAPAPPVPAAPAGKDETLIIDADDTLWENNVFYERATDRFLVLVEARGFGTTGVRQRLLEVERTNVGRWGYGSDSFARSLRDTLESYGGSPATARELAIIESLSEGVANIPIEFLPGVQTTLVPRAVEESGAERHPTSFRSRRSHDREDDLRLYASHRAVSADPHPHLDGG
jgi:hypothetical protein